MYYPSPKKVDFVCGLVLREFSQFPVVVYVNTRREKASLGFTGIYVHLSGDAAKRRNESLIQTRSTNYSRCPDVSPLSRS